MGNVPARIADHGPARWRGRLERFPSLSLNGKCSSAGIPLWEMFRVTATG